MIVLLVTCSTGLFLGLRYYNIVVVISVGFVTIACGSAALMHGQEVSGAVVGIAMAVISLQGGYLIGVIGREVWASAIAASRSNGWHTRVARTIRRPWRDVLRDPTIRSRNVDILAAMTAAALPWSTTAAAVLMALWLVALGPTIDWREFRDGLTHPASALPLAFVALATVGILWSDGSWSASLHGLKPVAKLLVIPFMLYHFQRSRHGPRHGTWVFVAFLTSCTLLMLLSWVVVFVPALKIAATASDGVPVKNYIDQSQEFALCAFALALPALRSFRERRWVPAIGYLALIMAFVVNMLFVVSARTALLYMPVLLVVFAARHLNRRAMLALLAGATVAAVLVWSTSPYLRQRIADIGSEYRAYETESDTSASTALRLEFWHKSITFFAEAPLAGHGTGSIRQLFERDAVGRTGLDAAVIGNPHNQTFNVLVQWGLVGGVVLYAMWLSHLLLFRRDDLAAWVGLATVVQNVVSSLLNSHLFDFHEGWMYVLGVGVAGGMALAKTARREQPDDAPRPWLGINSHRPDSAFQP